MIENILILDTETTGLEPKKGAQTIEVAVVLFNLKHKTILQQFSTLLPCETNPVEQINHIKAEATQCRYPFIQKIEPEQVEDAWKNPHAEPTLVYDEFLTYNRILVEMGNAAEACVAHNADFDKKFVATLPCGPYFMNKRWICTKNNFKWPVHLQRTRLEDICNAMRVPYLNAHRALIDCLLLAQCFEKVEDLESRFNRT